MNLKSITKKILGQKPQYGFFGFFNSWEEATKASNHGWKTDQVLEKVKNSLLKIKNGEAAYERDSVIFDKVQYSWPLLAGLLRVAAENSGELRVLDFGGSLGTTYFQNRKFLEGIILQWNIVEQPHYVKTGKKYFESDKLKFHTDFDACLQETNPHVLIVSSVIQYLERPYESIKKFVNSGVPYVIIDRTSFLETPEDKIAIQKVKPSIYEATFPIWFFNYEKFFTAFFGKYQVIAEFPAYLTDHYFVEGIPGGDRGIILKTI